MLPLLFTYAEQGLGLGEGAALSYDLPRISAALGDLLYVGKQRISLSLRLYQFSGEIQQSGMRARLQSSVPQEDLPMGLEGPLRAELAAHHSSAQLLRLLETTIRFLAVSASAAAAAATSRSASSYAGSDTGVDVDVGMGVGRGVGVVGGGGGDGEGIGGGASRVGMTGLSDFILRTLHVAPEVWREAAVPTLAATEVGGRLGYNNSIFLFFIHSFDDRGIALAC